MKIQNTEPPEDPPTVAEPIPPLAPREKRKYTPRQPKPATVAAFAVAHALATDLGQPIESVRTLHDVARELWSDTTKRPAADFDALPKPEQEEWCQRAREAR